MGTGKQIHLPLRGIQTQSHPVSLNSHGDQAPLPEHLQSQSRSQEAFAATAAACLPMICCGKNSVRSVNTAENARQIRSIRLMVF